jgi:hypothetical protein
LSVADWFARDFSVAWWFFCFLFPGSTAAQGSPLPIVGAGEVVGATADKPVLLKFRFDF